MTTTTAPISGTSLQKVLARYAVPQSGRATSNLLTSVALYLGLIAASGFAFGLSPWLAGGISVLASGFLLRTYIVFHDCAHGSFLPSKRANEWVGVVCALLVYSPFHSWRHEHAVHHATAGDLDRRGMGDVDTLTVAEYLARPWPRRLEYR